MKFYCFCEANCKYETMSKEQILAAIAQAAEGGLVFDVDAAFISQIREKNSGAALTFWVGTQAEYNRLTAAADPDPNCLYIIKDEKTAADLARWVEQNFMRKGETFDSGVLNVNAYTAPKAAARYNVSVIAAAAAGSASASCCPLVIEHAFLSATPRMFYGAAATDLFAVTAYLDASGFAHFEVSETAGKIEATKTSLILERVCGSY